MFWLLVIHMGTISYSIPLFQMKQFFTSLAAGKFTLVNKLKTWLLIAIAVLLTYGISIAYRCKA